MNYLGTIAVILFLLIIVFLSPRILRFIKEENKRGREQEKWFANQVSQRRSAANSDEDDVEINSRNAMNSSGSPVNNPVFWG